MTPEDFEEVLNLSVLRLTKDVRENRAYRGPKEFELRVREVIDEVAREKNLKVTKTFRDSSFPDIRANGFGVEVKTTDKDVWETIGNSAFEGMRDHSVKSIYVVFGKMGGEATVRWGRYEDKVVHVRTSHAPRFVIDMAATDDSLFKKMAVAYEVFAKLSIADKMRHIRAYARKRLKPGELSWWLEDESSGGIPVEVRIYMSLGKEEKRKLRAEGAILFPEIVGGGRKKDKYNKVAFYFLNHHNVFCPQTRDLFSAGSVAGKERGGNYLQRAIKDIQPEMLTAFETLDDELFEVYWGKKVVPHKRVKEWLRRADEAATDWRPSDHLFLAS